MNTMKSVAAIDIGSNAVRFLVSSLEEKDRKNATLRKIAFLRIPLRLGEDVFSSGQISARLTEKLIQTLGGFSHLMKALDVQSYRACATSALREAANGDDVINEVLEQCNLTIEIISGQEEAEIIYRASEVDDRIDRRSNALFVDVGGGSTEVVLYADGIKERSRSFRLGTVRMLQNKVEDGEIENFRHWLSDVDRQWDDLMIIGSGGNINKVHKLLNHRDGEAIRTDELDKLYHSLSAMSYQERICEARLNAYRADVIIPAMQIFLTIAQSCHVKKILVPKVGLVDGIARQISEKLQAPVR